MQTRTVFHPPGRLALLGSPLWLALAVGCTAAPADPSAAASAAEALNGRTTATTVAGFTATLTGASEVPPVVTSATGKATFSLVTPSKGRGDDDSRRSASTGSLAYSVETTGLTKVERIELRRGAVGAVGELVAVLQSSGGRSGENSRSDDGEDDSGNHGGSSSGGQAAGTLRVADLRGHFAHDWAGFAAALSGGELYVNVTTHGHSGGEIRGQCLPTTTTGNQAPNATITAPAADVTIAPGASVSFAGTATDPEGSAVTVLWDFGDGSTSTMLVPGAHTFATAGTYVVRLTATDAQGLADPTPATRTITVQAATANRAPDATITAPAANVTIVSGQSVSFAGTATDPDGNPVTVLWSFGDGSNSTALVPGAHSFGAAGVYTVTLTATDSLGLVDPTPATRTVTVTAVGVNAPPTGVITAPTGNVTIAAGASVSFTGTATDPDGNPVTVLWAFGDGSTSTALSPGSHTYVAAGTYTVRFTATDSLGLADPAPPTRTITVTPVVAAAPTLTEIQTTVFNSCTGCHSAGGSAGLNLTAGASYSNLVNVAATTFSGNRVVPFSPSTSALVTQLAGGHRSVSAANQAMIVAWITAGALNN
jgi:PKD repeat protein